MLLVATCMGLSWIMAYENIPQNVSAGLLNISDNPFVILLIINLILLFVGVFMDMTPAVLIFTPIFLPILSLLQVRYFQQRIKLHLLVRISFGVYFLIHPDLVL